MFSSEGNTSQSRQSTSSSFYIRDILGSDSESYNSQVKFPEYDLPTSEEISGCASSFQQSILPSSIPIPIPFMPYQQLCYNSPTSRGFSIDALVDVRNSETVPLPVYIRSRSPNGCDSLTRMKKCRRSRTVFTDLQLMGLEKRFEGQKYLSTPERIELSEALGLSQIQVKTWYQNRRMKWKKTVVDDNRNEILTSKSSSRLQKAPLTDTLAHKKSKEEEN